jgi:hypothetical protein
MSDQTPKPEPEAPKTESIEERSRRLGKRIDELEAEIHPPIPESDFPGSVV